MALSFVVHVTFSSLVHSVHPPPLTVLIVDDEPVARKVLREDLAEIPGIEIAAEAGNGKQALAAISQYKPDLVLLDLQMPGMTGFDVIRELENQPATWPSIVIVTAYDQHAIDAFEAGAVDYLLKPVTFERLARAVKRVREIRGNPQALAEETLKIEEAAASASQKPAPPRRIAGKLGEEFHLLDLSTVHAFQADRELVWIVTRKQKYLATLTLKAIQEKLAGLNFARVHRGALVNLDHVVKMAPMSSQRWMLTLENGAEFVVSKRQAKTMQGLMNW